MDDIGFGSDRIGFTHFTLEQIRRECTSALHCGTVEFSDVIFITPPSNPVMLFTSSPVPSASRPGGVWNSLILSTRGAASRSATKRDDGHAAASAPAHRVVGREQEVVGEVEVVHAAEHRREGPTVECADS